MADTSRRRRANGEASRSKILDAATEIASERGYEGTSINLVSKRCGLPASSIYWHFADKDDLIAAVIERSFGRWLSAWNMREDGTPRDRVAEMAMQVAKALLESPDFLRGRVPGGGGVSVLTSAEPVVTGPACRGGLGWA
ncbi:TetR/AcrR family transcriptional regulator, partial [Gordonia sp. NPDC003422]